jgi:hypothetical protein
MKRTVAEGSRPCFRLLAILLIVAVAQSAFAKSKVRVVVSVTPVSASIPVGARLDFKYSIANQWPGHTIGFSTCPPPYDIELFDSVGKIVPLSETWQRKMNNSVFVCSATALIEVKSGQTWGPAGLPGYDSDMFELKPGNYSGRLQWHFWTAHVGASRSEKEITVPSNSFTLIVVPQI